MSARVLVVDDILPNVKLLEAKLSSEYYDVITATSGEEALHLVEEASPDIVLLDVMMPGMDGFEVCQRIKSNPALAHIPVVMVTALTDATDRVRGLESGADDFLSKPVNQVALMARVRSLVRLKMTIDEWRIRENTASALGVVDQGAVPMNEPVNGASILVVEDRAYEADKITETLTRDDHIIIPAETGAIAMEIIAQHKLDMIIVSLNMSEEDSLRLCSHFRSNDKTRGVPILMLTQENDMDRIASGLEMGTNDYIMRPIDRNELLARVRTQIRRKRFQERLRDNYEAGLSMALTDPLTGLYNRRYFMTHLEKLVKKNKESKKTLAVLMLDIDHFKNVNDENGHNVGDEVLKIFAERLEESVRTFDLVARLGGEEFAAVLPDVNGEMAHMVAERLRRSIANTPFPVATDAGAITITTSIGGVCIDHNDTNETDALLDLADKQLYQAKNDGRDCVYFEKTGRLNPDNFTMLLNRRTEEDESS